MACQYLTAHSCAAAADAATQLKQALAPEVQHPNARLVPETAECSFHGTRSQAFRGCSCALGDTPKVDDAIHKSKY